MNATATLSKADLLRDVLARVERLTHLRPKRSGDWHLCRCPAHPDTEPSLSVRAGDRGIVFKCHAGCDAEAIATALGLKLADLFYEQKGTARRAPTDAGGRTSSLQPPASGLPSDALSELAFLRNWEPDVLRRLGATAQDGRVSFPMRDAAGKVTGQKVRRGDNAPIETATGGKVKSWTQKGGKHGLFYAPPLAAEGLVLVCEGEADTAAALSAGWAAVVGTAGAQPGATGRRTLQRLLKGRECVLAPHPDEAGCKWRDVAGRALAQVQCRVRYIPPDRDKDLDDRLRWAENAGKVLAEMVTDALPWQAAAPRDSSAPPAPPSRPLTDAGNAELLADLHGDALRYDHQHGRWLTWAGQWWQEDPDGLPIRLAKETTRQRYAEAGEMGRQVRVTSAHPRHVGAGEGHTAHRRYRRRLGRGRDAAGRRERDYRPAHG